MSIKEKSIITLTEDCDALLVPTATPIVIPSGTTLQVMQFRGENLTVVVGGNIARIDRATLIKIGLINRENPNKNTNLKSKEKTSQVDLAAVWEQLKTCYDPEIPVNIVELGLIYDCKIENNEEEDANLVKIKMTLTTPGCGMGPVIINEIKNKLLSINDVTDVDIELVFDPPWTRDCMSDAAKLELGLF